MTTELSPSRYGTSTGSVACPLRNTMDPPSGATLRIRSHEPSGVARYTPSLRQTVCHTVSIHGCEDRRLACFWTMIVGLPRLETTHRASVPASTECTNASVLRLAD